MPPPAIVPPVNEIAPAPATGEKVGAPQPDVVGLGDGPTFIAPGETGSVSAKATALMASFWLGLMMVKVRVDVPPARIGLGLNPLAIDGGTSAVRLALPTLLMLVPLSVVESVPLTLPCGPAVVAVTLTLTVQEPLAGIVPPLKVSEVAAAAGAHVGDPPQVVLAAGVAATCTPDGSESVKTAPVRAAVLVLVRVKVSVETPLTATGFGAKALAMVGWTAAAQPVKV